MQLKIETVHAFDEYVAGAEAGTEPTMDGRAPFLWSDADPESARQVRHGKIVARPYSGAPVRVPDGLIHDWVGVVYCCGIKLSGAVALVQDYDNHKNVYEPDVIDSRLLRRQNDAFYIYLRLLKKKIITVVLDTDHDVQYHALDGTRWFCRSHTTRISEVTNAGKPDEQSMPPDSGSGVLWRLYSCWRFQERDGGTYIECRAISLTRDVPPGLAWIINPIIRNLPGESLGNTLAATRRALAQRPPALL